MGPLLTRAIDRAGVADVAARALSGNELTEDDLHRLEIADLLIVGGLADAVRARHRGTAVKIWSPSPTLSPLPVATGAEILRGVAFSRLTTPVSRGVRVSCVALGLQVALVALAYGADELEIPAPSLTRPDSFTPIARMIEEAGRTVVPRERMMDVGA